MLQHIGETVEEDFYLMLPPSTSDAEYTLQAFSACFPSSFSPFAKFGMPITDIHHPVPTYAGRLKRGVNRSFERMKAGKIVERFNVNDDPDKRLCRYHRN